MLRVDSNFAQGAAAQQRPLLRQCLAADGRRDGSLVRWEDGYVKASYKGIRTRGKDLELWLEDVFGIWTVLSLPVKVPWTSHRVFHPVGFKAPYNGIFGAFWLPGQNQKWDPSSPSRLRIVRGFVKLAQIN